MEKIKILWADDEIELLKPHLIFLKEKGYDVHTANNGEDALELFSTDSFDMVFLDENMPGLSGLETLAKIKDLRAEVPVIMITKSEEEHIMEDAIGSRIADYLIKPVNPMQILLSIKKNIDERRLVSEKTTQNYLQAFRNLSISISDNQDWEDWAETYRKLVHWEMELEKVSDNNLLEILANQKTEANLQFCKYIEDNYEDWIQGRAEDAPALSHTLFRRYVQPLLAKERKGPVYLVVIDNLRWDQWKVIQPKLNEFFRTEDEKMFCSILPTATHFARNALFAGLMPAEIAKLYPKLWVDEDEEGGKNAHEDNLLQEQLKRLGLSLKTSYHKITNLQAGKKLAENLGNFKANDLNVIVYNFVDMLSHARTEMEVIRELADDEPAYRSITSSWFNNSPLLEMFKSMAEQNAKVIICTDHGTIRVKEPTQVVGDRNTTTNLRYKQGKNLRYESEDVMEVDNPDSVRLPRINVSTRYIFAKSDRFFAYPNNFNYYVSYYRNTFQHGGISMEEMIIPFAVLAPR
jgi:DNA-binding response OmpR family regulator